MNSKVAVCHNKEVIALAVLVIAVADIQLVQVTLVVVDGADVLTPAPCLVADRTRPPFLCCKNANVVTAILLLWQSQV